MAKAKNSRGKGTNPFIPNDEDYSMDSMIEEYQELNNLSRDLNKLAKENISYTKTLKGMEQQIKELYMDKLDAGEEITSTTKYLLKIQAEQYKSIAEGNANEFKANWAMLKLRKEFPKITDQEINLASQLFDKLQEQTSEYLKQKESIDYINEQYTEANKHLDELKGKFKNWYTMVKEMVFSPKFSLAIFMASAAENAIEFGRELNEARKNMGLMAGQMGNMAGAMSSAMFSLEGIASGITIKESAQAYEGIVHAFGSIKDATQEHMIQVGKLISLYGLSGEEAAHLVKMTELAGGYNLDSAKALAKANGVPVGQMLKDVAQNTEHFSKYAKNGGENIFKAATFARKLGLELSTVAKISDALLSDPTASIEKEMEASVLLGKQLDMNNARQLMYDGKHEEAMKAVMSQLGGMEAWQNMDIYQKQAVADLLGVQVDEAEKLMSAQKKNQTLSEGIFSAWDKLGETSLGVLGTTKEWGVMLFSGITTLGQLVFNMRQLGIASKAQWVWTKLVTAAQWAWNGAMKAGAAIGNLFSGKNAAKGGIDAAAAYRQKMFDIGKNAPKFPGTTKNIGGGIASGPAGNRMPDVTRSSAGVEGAQKTVSGLGKNMGNLLKGAAAAAVLAGAIYILANALRTFNDVDWESIAKGSVGLGILTGGLFILSKFMSAGAEDMFIGALAIAALGAALIPFGYAMSFLAGVDWATLMSVPAVIAAIAGEMFVLGLAMFTGVGAGLFLAGAAAIAVLGASLIPLGIALEKMAPGLPAFSQLVKTIGGVADIGDKVGDFFDSMASGVERLTESLEGLSKYNDTLGKLVQLSGMTTGMVASAPPLQQTTSLTSPGGVSGTAATTPPSGQGMNDEKADVIIAKLSELINVVSGGASVEIDGVKFLRYLNKHSQAKGTESSYTSGRGNY